MESNTGLQRCLCPGWWLRASCCPLPFCVSALVHTLPLGSRAFSASFTVCLLELRPENREVVEWVQINLDLAVLQALGYNGEQLDDRPCSHGADISSR